MKNIITTALILVVNMSVRPIESSSTCDCQPLGPPQSESYLVTRLWDIIGADISAQDVIDEFQSGFAPIVTELPGFQRYTAATTGNASTVFFMNAFDTEQHAKSAQEAAKTFVAEGTLQGLIKPNTFTEDHAIYGFPTEACITESSTGQFLSTRLFNWLEPETVDIDALVAAGTSFNDKVKDLDGYITYVGTLSNENPNDLTFVYNIYNNEETSVIANEMGQSNAANNTVEVPQNKLVVSTQGQIMFDYLCAETDAATTKETDEKEETETDADTDTSDTSSGVFRPLTLFYIVVISFAYFL